MIRRYLARRKMRWAVGIVRDLRAKERLGRLTAIGLRRYLDRLNSTN